MKSDKFVDGWLDRQGRLHLCKFMGHNAKANRLQKSLHLPNTLEYLGWFKVHSAGVCFYEAWTYHNRQHVRPTKRQLKWLFLRDYDIERYKQN